MSDNQNATPGRQVIGYQTPLAVTPISPTQLSEMLHEAGYPSVTQGKGGRGGGGALIQRGRLIMDTGGEGSGARYVETEDVRTELGSGQGWLNLGYAVINTRRLRVYPLLGLGGLGAGIDTRKRSPVITGVYVEGQNNPPETRPERMRVALGGPFLLLGLGADLRLRVGRLTFMLGLRAGVMFMPFRPRVQVDDGPPPELDLPRTGPFVRVVTGMGFASADADQHPTPA